MSRYLQHPISPNELIFVCEHCFDMIAYTDGDIVKKLRDSTLSLKFIVYCSSCGFEHQVKVLDK